ncbi:MAG: molybdenum cofactor guanylyltransferase [Peptostreptococcaceae bacterium]
MIKKTLAILAGGKGSRMNYKNKALLSYQNKTFIENLLEVGKNFEEIIIVANNKEAYKQYNVRIIPDIYKDKGPLGGIHSALLHSKFDKVFCIACDMPLLSEECLNIIGEFDFSEDILVPKSNGRMQPLCAVYSKNIIDSVEKNIIENNNKLQHLIINNNYKIIDMDFSDENFININTPEEYRNLEE